MMDIPTGSAAEPGPNCDMQPMTVPVWPWNCGKMAARIREYDWAATPLGPIDGWPQSLKALVDLMLATPQLATLAVGPERIFLYNDEASRHYGDRHPGVLGCSLAEAFPHEFVKVAPFYDRVFAGEVVHVPAQPLDPAQTGVVEVFDAHLAPVRDGDGRVIAAYMTGFAIGERQKTEARLRENESRQALLLRLGDTILTISDTAVIQQTAMRMLGEHLGLSRAYYFDVVRENDGWVHVIEAAYQRELDELTMVGRHALQNFGDTRFEGFAHGEVVAATDVSVLPDVTPEELASYHALGVTAFINVPLLRNGEYNAGIGAHDTQARVWRQAEIDLIREVAARTWMAVERVRTEIALNRSEERIRNALMAPGLGVFDWDLVTDRIECTEGFRTLTGASESQVVTGTWVTENVVHPDDRDYLSARFAEAIAPGSGSYHFEHRTLTHVGLRWIHTFGKFYFKGEGSQRHPIRVSGNILDITERKLAEEALRDSEEALAADLANAELLRGLAERLVTEENVSTIYDEILSAVLIIARGDAGTIQIYNVATRSLELLVTRNFSRATTDYFHHVDASTQTACGIAMNTGQRTFVDFANEGADFGCRLLVDEGLQSALALPLLSRSGAPLGMLNVHWRVAGYRPTGRQMRFLDLIARQTADLIEQRRDQGVLRESEERLRQFGEASQDILWIRDTETLQWTYLTPAFEAIYGLSRAEALSGDNYRNWQDMIVPEDHARAVASIAQVSAGERVTFEYRIRRPADGQVRWLRNTDFPMHDATGRVNRIGGVGHDVTELKASQAAMADSEMRLRTLTGGIPQLVWRSCAKGLWTWCSPQWMAFTGQTQTESHGVGWLDVVHPDDRTAATQAWEDAQSHGRLDVEYRVRRAADSAWLWHRTRSVPVRDPALDVTEDAITEWLGTTTDIDDLKRLQGEQQVLVAELQHRTRNLLAVVRNVARRSIGPSPERDEYDARLSALGRVQGFLSRSPGYSVLLADLVEAELHATGDGASDKVEVGGPPVDLPGESVQAVALALHELATNAVKYGAIAQPSARLSVLWRVEAGEDGAECLVIDWRESGVSMPGGLPTRRGYGSELITQALPYQLGAETALEFARDGVRCQITLPASAFSGGMKTELA